MQELLAKHPDLLAGDQIDSDEPRRWLLITREMAVASEDGGAERRSLDHLFLDQDAIPTLVEVKRRTNTDIRRKVVGQTETARRRRSPGANPGKQWDEPMFMAALAEHKGDEARGVAEDLLHWIAPQVTYVYWGIDATEGGIVPVITHGNAKFHVCRMSTRGWFIFRFDWLCNKPPFSDEAVRQRMLAKINEIPGVRFGEDVLTKRARIPFQSLTSSDAVEKLKSAIAWLIKQVNAEFTGTASEHS